MSGRQAGERGVEWSGCVRERGGGAGRRAPEVAAATVETTTTIMRAGSIIASLARSLRAGRVSQMSGGRDGRAGRRLLVAAVRHVHALGCGGGGSGGGAGGEGAMTHASGGVAGAPASRGAWRSRKTLRPGRRAVSRRAERVAAKKSGSWPTQRMGRGCAGSTAARRDGCVPAAAASPTAAGRARRYAGDASEYHSADNLREQEHQPPAVSFRRLCATPRPASGTATTAPSSEAALCFGSTLRQLTARINNLGFNTFCCAQGLQLPSPSMLPAPLLATAAGKTRG